MYTSIRHYSLNVERDAPHRQPRAYAIVVDRQPSLRDRIRAILSGRSGSAGARA